MNKLFFNSQMKYFITGGAGFVGRHLTRLLLREGHTVLAMDNFENSNMSDVTEWQGRRDYTFYYGSIVKDTKLLDKLIQEADIVIHLAASVGVANATNNPSLMLKANVVGMMNVIDACAKYNKRVVVSSSSEVYGWSPKSPFKEDAEFVVPNPFYSRFSYALSKLVEEYYSIGFLRSHNLPITVIRIFNSTGIGQNNRHKLVLPSMLEQALTGKPIYVHGDGGQTRCFCDVRETVFAIYSLSRTDKSIGEVVNIGTDRATKMIDLAKMVKKISGSSSPIELVPYSKVFKDGFMDMRERIPDLSKVYELIKWRATEPLEMIITAMVIYEKNKRGI